VAPALLWRTHQWSGRIHLQLATHRSTGIAVQPQLYLEGYCSGCARLREKRSGEERRSGDGEEVESRRSGEKHRETEFKRERERVKREEREKTVRDTEKQMKDRLKRQGTHIRIKTVNQNSIQIRRQQNKKQKNTHR
jgi:hypothetical protein